MQRNNHAVMIVLTLLLAGGTSACEAQSLNDLWTQSTTSVYKMPTTQELRTAQDLFREHFKGRFDEKLVQQWEKLGFQAQPIEQDKHHFFVIREHKEQRHGRGFFVFTPNRQAGITLQSPHRYHDRHTGDLALKLLMSSDTVVAAAWNTTARNTANKYFNNADMAHLTQSHFTAFARAFSSIEKGSLIQIHGFSKQKRRTKQAAEADIIISSATNMPGVRTQKISACLKHTTTFKVRIYPWDVQELGGTTNTVANALRATGSPAFVHMELNLDTRQKLLNNATLLKQFSHCLPMGGSL